MDRVVTHRAVSEHLSRLDDEEIAALLEAQTGSRSSTGARSSRLVLGGTAVFAKRIPLTDLERRPENVRSTANLFEIPAVCHYGLGGPGFGAWRELACGLIATEWALSGRCASFPLLHHWRVVPRTPRSDEVDVGFWVDLPPVRERARAMRHASADLVLFLEHVPQNLLQWLGPRLAAGADAAREAVALVDANLAPTLAFVNERGLTHFDPHFENILTDGLRLYLGDFGLALSSDFDLSDDERAFLARHRRYDVGRAAVGYAHCASVACFGPGDWRRSLRHYLETSTPAVPPAVDAVLRREGPLALAFLQFSSDLQRDASTRYPEDL
jgi:hypothetical protein